LHYEKLLDIKYLQNFRYFFDSLIHQQFGNTSRNIVAHCNYKVYFSEFKSDIRIEIKSRITDKKYNMYFNNVSTNKSYNENSELCIYCEKYSMSYEHKINQNVLNKLAVEYEECDAIYKELDHKYQQYFEEQYREKIENEIKGKLLRDIANANTKKNEIEQIYNEIVNKKNELEKEIFFLGNAKNCIKNKFYDNEITREECLFLHELVDEAKEKINDGSYLKLSNIFKRIHNNT